MFPLRFDGNNGRMLPRWQKKDSVHTLLSDYSALVGDAVLRQRAQTAEQEARIQTEIVNKIRSEFMANMSHELRTPLNTVMGFSKMLASHDSRPLKDQEIVEYAGIIHDAASHLLAVINDILDITKLQSGRFILDQQDIEIDEVLRTCLFGIRASAKEAGVTINDSIAEDLASVRGDPNKLQQIFTNVLSNAIKFTPKNGTITLRAFNDTPDSITVSVADTGIGMSQDDIAIALTPFGQVDGSHTRWREGAGLGLPMANGLTQMHEGKLTIVSEPNKGTTVTVILPSSSARSVAEARDAALQQVT